MEQTVEIPVNIGGQEQVYSAKVQAWRYGHRFLVDVDGVEVTLERDDAGEFRAILPDGFTGKIPEKEVVTAIIDILQAITGISDVFAVAGTRACRNFPGNYLSMRKLFTLFFVVLSVATSVAQSRKVTAQSVVSTSGGDKESVLAILYQQRAAEYAALCLQAYNLAKRKVDAAIANPELTEGDLPLAVITDLDETALDNSANEVRQFLKDSLYDPTEFNRWIQTIQADTVPGSTEFFNYVDSLSQHGPKKIDIYYISNRDASMVSYTMTNMKNIGFPQCDDASHFKFKSSTSSKEPRRQEVLKDHQIVVLLGDNLIDLDAHFDGYQQTPDQRRGQVYNFKDRWGDLYIVFPNADYGDWESYLYYQYRLDHKGVPPSNLKYIEERRQSLLRAPIKPF